MTTPDRRPTSSDATHRRGVAASRAPHDTDVSPEPREDAGLHCSPAASLAARRRAAQPRSIDLAVPGGVQGQSIAHCQRQPY
ncbi:hypothetical protein BDA96_09G019400 [Sorghum bicolor]|uniref:Uncharacterized protein n=2 Tax=Sorghum bicolor TaxID=4558 RepID=A0A921U3G8_SORBI|nr:hypothetical protein BDA96_09G019400 [Sorghum bicolor]KAG0516625.1 hypothetical protein BDA96_09G019400 [Sorghum bicolor]KXG21127.1 hypothetical protein SORBI_3009G018700 [Sorghum bicolor]